MADTPRKTTVSFYSLAWGTYMGTCPVTGLQFADAMNGQAGFSGNINISDLNIQAMQPLTFTIPGACLAVVDLSDLDPTANSAPLGAWIITDRKRHKGSDGFNLQLTGESLWWWLTKRVQAADYSDPPYSSISGTSTPMQYWTGDASTGTGADNIVLQLLFDILGYYNYGRTPGATVPVDPLGGLTIAINGSAFIVPDTTPPTSHMSVVPSTYWIAPTFPYSSLATIDSCFSQIVPLGYDVGVDVTLSVAYGTPATGPPSRYAPLIGTINISYPRKGTTAAVNGYAIDMDRSRSYDMDEDAGDQGTIMYETGVTGAMSIFENVNPYPTVAGGPGWPVLEQVNSQSGLSGQDAPKILNSLAQSDSYLGSFPIFSGTVTLPLWGADPPFGPLVSGGLPCVTGDSAQVIMSPDPCFPVGINEELRMTAWQVNLPEQGDQTITITLNAPPVAGAATGPLP